MLCAQAAAFALALLATTAAPAPAAAAADALPDALPAAAPRAPKPPSSGTDAAPALASETMDMVLLVANDADLAEGVVAVDDKSDAPEVVLLNMDEAQEPAALFEAIMQEIALPPAPAGQPPEPVALLDASTAPFSAPPVYVEGDAALRDLQLHRWGDPAAALERRRRVAGGGAGGGAAAGGPLAGESVLVLEVPHVAGGARAGSAAGAGVVADTADAAAAAAAAPPPARPAALAAMARDWLVALAGDGRDRVSDTLRVLDNQLDNALAGAQGRILNALPIGGDAAAMPAARELVSEAVELVSSVRSSPRCWLLQHRAWSDLCFVRCNSVLSSAALFAMTNKLYSHGRQSMRSCAFTPRPLANTNATSASHAHPAACRCGWTRAASASTARRGGRRAWTSWRRARRAR